ncbi:MAG: efflux RND transporter periplasmic adaptor subunit [Bacteroidota bacterium]|nr:efflux RND transporter periplasmic adaptor subunit [Bacteroidota bacterium]
MRILIIIIVLIGILLTVKYLFFPAPDVSKLSAGPQNVATKAATPVEVMIAKAEAIDNKLQVSGTIYPNEKVDLKPEISGKITALYLKEGSTVKKGQVLIRLNDADLRAQLKKTKSQIKLSGEKLKRYQELLKIQGIAQEEFDNESNVLQSLRADEEVLYVQIARTRIIAPFDGILGLRQVSEGSYITSQQIVATIQQIDPIKVEFSIPERYAAFIKSGNGIKFTIEGSDKRFDGKVYAYEPSIDMATRTLKVRAKAPNAHYKIIPGSFANVEVVLDNIGQAVMVPSQAIVPILKGQQVFLAKNGKATPVAVETGIRNDIAIQILSGINPGDTVITTGIMGLRSGADIKIINQR